MIVTWRGGLPGLTLGRGLFPISGLDMFDWYIYTRHVGTLAVAFQVIYV